MRRSFAAATLAASVTVGGLAGAVLGTPGLAGAQEATAGAVSWVQDALGGLVTDGTITQAQADAVETALAEARPARRFGHGIRGAGLEAVAEALGLTQEQLRTELRNGTTLAALAEEEGVEVQALIDAIVAAHRERLEEKVAAGDLTREEADARSAEAEDRARAIVNGEAGVGDRGHHRRGARGAAA